MTVDTTEVLAGQLAGDRRAAAVEGLRRLADWLEQADPAVTAPYGLNQLAVYFTDDVDEFGRVASDMGLPIRFVRWQDQHTRVFEAGPVDFGAVKLRLVGLETVQGREVSQDLVAERFGAHAVSS